MNPQPSIHTLDAALALGHLTREYPNKLDHVMASAVDVQSPRALHPIFYGSFDWHSCVHGYWLIARLYDRFPELPEAAAIRSQRCSACVPAASAPKKAIEKRPIAFGHER